MKEPQVRPAVWRGQTTSGLWPDIYVGSAPTSHLRDLDFGGGPNGATTRSELIPIERVAPFIATLSTHVNPGQPNFRSPKAGRQPLSIQRAMWLAGNLGRGSEFITRFLIGRFQNMATLHQNIAIYLLKTG